MPEPVRSGPTGPEASWSGQVTFDAASCGPAAVTIQTVPLPLADLGDTILLTPPAAGLSVAVAIGIGYCSVKGTAKVPFINPTAGALDPASAVYDYIIIKSLHIP